MIRKTIISGVLAAGSFAGMVFNPGSADAAPPASGPAYGQAYGPNVGPFPPRGRDRHDDRDIDWRNRAKFQVVVQHRGHWDVVESFRDRDDAQRLAWRLERQGQNAEVRRVG